MLSNQSQSSSVNIFTKGLKYSLSFFKFDPVDMVSGRVVYAGLDFSLPGPIPFEWKRCWYSDSQYHGLLGNGVHFVYDRYVQAFPEYNIIGMLLSDGRVSGFPFIEIEESFYNRIEKTTLTRKVDRYEAYNHEEHLNYIFEDVGHDHYKLTRIENESGLHIALNYENGKLKTVVDSAGRLMRIDTDKQGRILSVTIDSPFESVTKVSYTYDKEGNMTHITDALGQSTVMAFENDRMVKKTDRNGQSFYWKYDQKGRCYHTWGDGGVQEGKINFFPEQGYNEVIDANGAKTLYFYDEEQLVHRIQNPMGHSSHFVYTDYMELYREINEDGEMTGYTYNDRGFLTSQTYPDGTKTQYIYDAHDRLIINSSPEGSKQVFTYHGQSSLVKAIIHPDKSATHYTYNPQGLPVKIKNKGDILNLFYDAQSNLSRVQAKDIETRWDYDYQGQVIATRLNGELTQKIEYDRLGRASALYNKNGSIEIFKYNAYDEVLSILKDSKTVAEFAYTPMGSLKQRKQGKEMVNFVYDPMEQLTKVINEHGEDYSFRRDKAGNIVTEKSFDGITKHFLRSPSGKVLGIKGPDQTETNFSYNANGQVSHVEYHDGTWEAYGYNKDGLLVSAKNEQAQINFTRDANGQIAEEKQSRGFNDKGYQIKSKYDHRGLRTTLKSTSGIEINNQYDHFGRLTQMQARQEHNHPWSQEISYNQDQTEVIRQDSRGVTSKMLFDASGRPIGQLIKNSLGRETYKRRYTWNKANQLIHSSNELSHNATIFSYDELYQLVSASTSGDNTYKNPDAIGNLYETPDRSDRKYVAGGQLKQDQNWHYYYDGLGNLVLKSPYPLAGKTPNKTWRLGCWHYTWQGNGMLKTVKQPNGKEIHFEYDALGRRTAKIAGEKITRYFWDGNVLLNEWSYDLADRPEIKVSELGELYYDATEPVENLVTWVYEEGSYVPSAKIENGQTYSIISDYIGRPVQAFDEAGEVVWETDYDIYGRLRDLKGSENFIPFRQLGQYEDVELDGLYYNRFRYYDSNTGLYISQDPIGLAGNNPNFYGYVFDSNVEVDVWGLTRSNAGKAALHKRLMNDDKLPRHIRGWFKHQYKKGIPFSKMTIPEGYDRAHFRGYESAKGYDYRYSELNLRSNHELQHKYDDYGVKNKEGVSKKGLNIECP